MSTQYLNTILDHIGDKNVMHYKKLKKNIAFDNAEYVARAEAFFKRYEELLADEGKELPYALDSYLQMCNDMMFEQIRFSETGKYSSTSFAEVNERVYNNPEVMGYYMHGLLVSQYLWDHHYKVLEFFFNNIGKYSGNMHHILEVGGGHGLYTNEIINHLTSDYTYTMVDISKTSIDMSKVFVGGDKVQYVHQDVYQYTSDTVFDFVIMGEVMEHVEDPHGLMRKLHELSTKDAVGFVTAPCNSPTIDHIYLFRHPDDIRALLQETGWEIVSDIVASSEAKRPDAVNDPLIPVMYGAFIRKKA